MNVRWMSTLVLALLATGAVAQEGRTVFVDEFDGTSLGEAWEVLAPDPARLSVTDGAAVVVPWLEVAREKPREAQAFNRLRWKGELPEAFELTLEFEHLAQDGQWVRVDLVEGADHGVSAWTDFENQRNLVRFEKRIRGRPNALSTPMKSAAAGRRVETIRIRREGRAWTCFQRLGETEWTLLHRILRMRPAEVSFHMAFQGAKIQEEPVRFLRFEVKDLAR